MVWTTNGSGDLGYSSLLAAIAPTAAARQGILRSYFIPSDEERNQGIKVPSPAHHAIAQLVKHEIVRVQNGPILRTPRSSRPPHMCFIFKEFLATGSISSQGSAVKGGCIPKAI